MTVNKLPEVGRIQGVQLTKGPDPKQSTIDLQYTDPAGRWHEVTMPFLDGMYLLNLLRAVQIDMGFDMPFEPPA